MDETKQIEKNNSHQLKNIENECKEIKNKLLNKKQKNKSFYLNKVLE